MVTVSHFKVMATSLVTKDNYQKIELTYVSSHVAHLTLRVKRGDSVIVDGKQIALCKGKGGASVFLPVQQESVEANWILLDSCGAVVAETEGTWTKPREWTLHIMVSSHTDIGLHNSQYIQRANSIRFIEKAKALCDKTDNRKENDQYRYVVEGTWFWENYVQDRGTEAAEALVEKYIKPGKIGVCGGVAGNCTQTYGLEEVCRSAYERRKLLDRWGISTETLTMIDMNGLSMGIIQPYANAGYKNIIFAPNQWNPIPSTIWEVDDSKIGATWNTDAGGGGSRIDVRYDSELPMVFYWENESGNRLLVWASTSYEFGGAAFGLFHRPQTLNLFPQEKCIAKQLHKLEQGYPFDAWFLACYVDDQEPDDELVNEITEWNDRWKWPQMKLVGNPDAVFNHIRSQYDDMIPVLRGDITGGWWQIPLSAAELLAQKFEVDRLLPTAEKWSVIASLLHDGYTYPEQDFSSAWKHLLYNDEHSYGVSGYQGRRVYETWMQHRDWIEKATDTAVSETYRALNAIASNIPCNEKSSVVFNQTMQHRSEIVTLENGKHVLAQVPPLGYCVIPHSKFMSNETSILQDQPPTIENRFYRLSFNSNGSIAEIFDKEIGRSLLDGKSPYAANELLYTKDNHKTFAVPEDAVFYTLHCDDQWIVSVQTKMDTLGAEIIQTIILPEHEKRIDIDNQIRHAKDMINSNRYYRYIYFAFPFDVKNARRFCHLNGAVAEYGKTVTGHGTDVYMAVNEWCCCENHEYGIALLMKDSQLVEFDRIHPDKTDFSNLGDSSNVYVYAANDWLQMHIPGGSHLDYRFRFAITSYSGTFSTAKIPQMAERYVNPVLTVGISPQVGALDDVSMSFLHAAGDMRLLALKRAEDGKGVVARFYGRDVPLKIQTTLPIDVELERLTVDEHPAKCVCEDGFITYRLFREIEIPIRKVRENADSLDGAPSEIGSVYTGLITKPKAAAGEGRGHLYLLWGQNTDKDFSHYKLYRSEDPEFFVDDKTFLAEVYPEEYRVGRYEDTGLKDNTCYFYRVCAVNTTGVCGKMSDIFSAFTREL